MYINNLAGTKLYTHRQLIVFVQAACDLTNQPKTKYGYQIVEIGQNELTIYIHIHGT